MAVSGSGLMTYTSDSGTYEIVGGKDGGLNLRQLN
jgi:hypothetical protein